MGRSRTLAGHKRIPVTPFRTPEPIRTEFVARYGEAYIVAAEAFFTREADLIINGDPDGVMPVGILRGRSPLQDLC